MITNIIIMGIIIITFRCVGNVLWNSVTKPPQSAAVCSIREGRALKGLEKRRAGTFETGSRSRRRWDQ
jgi:hypothetical protein